MKNNKIIGVMIIASLVLPLTLFQLRTNMANATEITAKDKLPAFLSDVIGLDLTKYNTTEEGYGTSYPPEYGGVAKVEQFGLTLADANGDTITVGSEFVNGFPTWIHVRALTGLLHYAIQPQKDALAESRNIFERYAVFAQKYNIDTANMSLALSLLSKAPSAPSTSGDYSNFNKMSDFTPANITSGNMKIGISQTGIGLCYTANDVDMPNKSVGMDFSYGTFVFSDTWSLFGIGSFSVVSKEEATSLMFEAAKKYCETLQIGTSSGPVSINPEWSSRMDVGLNMIRGQQYNNSLNKLLLSNGTGVSMGNTVRDPLALYPMWHAIFYFNHTISGVVGIQVTLWGDTKEIVYCDTYGYLGSSGQPSTDDTEQTQTPSPDNSGQASNNQATFLSTELIACITFAAIVAIVTATVLLKKKHK
jgi:hypothetical protein